MTAWARRRCAGGCRCCGDDCSAVWYSGLVIDRDKGRLARRCASADRRSSSLAAVRASPLELGQRPPARRSCLSRSFTARGAGRTDTFSLEGGSIGCVMPGRKHGADIDSTCQVLLDALPKSALQLVRFRREAEARAIPFSIWTLLAALFKSLQACSARPSQPSAGISR